MDKKTYREAFERAKNDYDALILKRSETEEILAAIDADLVKVRRGVIALAAMCGEELDEMNLGLTDSLRALFSQATKTLEINDVMKGVEDLGYDLSTQKNPKASIMAVLSRLVEAKEIRAATKIVKQPNGTNAGVRVWIGKNVR